MPYQQTFCPSRSKRRGSILVLVFFFIVLLTLEVAMVNLIANRSLGEEGVYSSRGASAQMALTTAVNRLSDDLYAYLAANGDTNVTTDFARGGANDISEVLQAKKPSTGALENTDFTIEAWVEQKRGIWYKISARAISGDIEQSSHRWVKLNPCLATSDATLTTILTGRPFPGRYSIYVASDERAFWGETGASANFYTWKNGVLSTLVSGRDNIGEISTNITDSGRVYFGQNANPGNLYTWKDGVLSTLLTNRPAPGVHALEISGERAFFGDGNNFYTHLGNALSTIVTSQSAPGNQSVATDATGRVFFGELFAGASFWTWKNGVLTTIVASANYPGRESATAFSDSVAFGENHVNSRFWYWNAATGLSTIPLTEPDLGMRSTRIDTTGRVFFGEQDYSSPPDKFYTWKNNQLSTIVHSVNARVGNYDRSQTSMTTDNRLFLSQPNGWGGEFWTWKDFVLSTIIPNSVQAHDPGYQSMNIASDGRVFFGEANTCCGPTSYRTWKDNVLSTIITFNPARSLHQTSTISPDGRFFFGTVGASSNYYSWKDNVLTTIVSGVTSPGHQNNFNQPGSHQYNSVKNNRVSPQGTLFFAENANPGKLWAWTPPIECNRNY